MGEAVSRGGILDLSTLLSRDHRETSMPVAQRSKVISCGIAINLALTIQSTLPKDSEGIAAHNLSPSLPTHAAQQVETADELRPGLLDVRSIHQVSAPCSYHRAL
jgi:hypothetical protein